MGYHAEVALVCTNEFEEKFKELMKQFEVSAFHNPDKKITKDGVTLYYWARMRWELLDKDIVAMNALLEEEDPDTYLYLNVGATFDDISQQGYLDNPFTTHISSQIEFNE